MFRSLAACNSHHINCKKQKKPPDERLDDQFVEQDDPAKESKAVKEKRLDDPPEELVTQDAVAAAKAKAKTESTSMDDLRNMTQKIIDATENVFRK